MSREEPAESGGTLKRPKVERQSDGIPLGQQEAELQRLRQQVIDLKAVALEHEVQLRSEEVWAHSLWHCMFLFIVHVESRSVCFRN